MEEIYKIYSLTPPGLMRETEREPQDDMPIGMAYVPWQSFRDLYEKDKAIMRGTIFAELDKPFKGAKR